MDRSPLDTSWIWHPDWIDSSRTSAGGFVYFRKTFTIETLPDKEARIYITADTRYQLYVNSNSIATGPVKGDEHLWFYDEIDIAPYLHVGTNCILVRVLRFYFATKYAISFPRLPIPGLSMTPAYSPGGILDGVGTDATWGAALDMTTKLRIDQEEDYFLHVYEDVDMTKQLELNWVAAEPVDVVIENGVTTPWRLSPRLIPFLRHEPAQFKTIHNIRSIVSSEEWENALLSQTPPRGVILPRGTSHHLELEAEAHLTSMLRFCFERPKKGGSMLRIKYSECYEDASTFTPWLRCKGDRCDSSKRLLGPEDKYVFGGSEGKSFLGDQACTSTSDEETFAPFHFRTFRYISLDIDVGKNSDLVLRHLDLTRVRYPLDVSGDFNAPGSPYNDEYQAIWATSVRTLENCMHDCYEDCPFYEQLQYAMDVRSSCLFTYRISGDDRLARQAIIQIHNTYRHVLGLTASRGPCHEQQIIPHFSLFWICMATDHFEYFADEPFTRRFLSACHGVLEAFHSRMDANIGLVASIDSKTSSFWDFVDWTDEWRPAGIPKASERTGFLSYTNMLYAYTLQRLGKVLTALGRNGISDEYSSRAESIVEALRTNCRGEKFFTDGLSKDANETADYSQHSQVWAVLCGAVTGDEAHELLKKSLSPSEGLAVQGIKFTQLSTAMSFYALRALALIDGPLYDDMFHSFWKPWRTQLSQNLTTWCEDTVSLRSDCHAWACASLFEFMAEVAGLQPAEPGWEVIRFKPRVKLFPQFSATVPMRGRFSGMGFVKWHTQGNVTHVSLRIEAGNWPNGDLPTVSVSFPDGRDETFRSLDVSVEFSS
ncbi:hypothetical protein CEP54_012656 [Fusarium duplospermum]|uniref:Alpha-L-rhamnosidase six-hairpin glycosidase domain-containing protein n=1 Tax=Fusarium duplospermum TaxID=1325734 RepID=A0A428P7P3_9HYPO|nr:hypothetical protein CEP54_012656 [Fusarium duplospermum]